VPAIFLALVFMGRAFSFAHSDAPSLPAGYRLEPSPAVVALTAGDEAPDASSLLDAAILFSGANPARTEAAKKRGIDAVGKARSLTGSEPDAYTRGKIVLDMVHSIISSYSELETRLDVALLDGRYNCVGSSTLYAILARAAGLEVRGVILPDHAYCYLMIDGKRVDVETTVADGYDATVHRLASGSAKGIDTGTRGVVALALRNRATLLERASRWPEALALAVDAYAYTVLAEEMRKSGNHRGAWEVATEAQRRFPASKEMASLAGTARSNWVISVHNRFAALYNAGRYFEAIVLVEEALELVPGERRLLDDISTARKALP
jgi:tetratricopeptide (TPR) repeat protein